MSELKPPRLTSIEIRDLLARGTKDAAALDLQLRNVFSLSASTSSLVLR